MNKLLFLFWFVPTFATAQLYETPDDIYFEQVVLMEDKSKDELFLAAKEWLVEAFMGPKDVLRLEDRENGKLVAYGNEGIKIKVETILKILGVATKKSINTNNRLLFVIKLYFKEGRTKFTFSRTRVALIKGRDIEKEAPLTNFYFNKKGKPRTKTKELKKEVATIFNKIAADYERSLRKNSAVGDW